MKYKVSVLIVSAYDDEPMSVRYGEVSVRPMWPKIKNWNGLVRARVAVRIDGEEAVIVDYVSGFDEVDHMVHQAANELLIYSNQYTSCQIGAIGYDAV